MKDVEKMAREMFSATSGNDQATDNSTPAYRQYRNIMIRSSYKFDSGRPVEITMFPGTVWDDDEQIKNLYFMTRFMRDGELSEINDVRRVQGLEPLPRLAYIGNLKFAAVNSQKERVFRESQKFGNVPERIISAEQIVAQAQPRGVVRESI